MVEGEGKDEEMGGGREGGEEGERGGREGVRGGKEGGCSPGDICYY